MRTLLAVSAQILLSCGLLGAFAVMSGYHLSAFELGQIKAHVYHGLAPYAISKILVKGDGETHWSWNAIKAAAEKLESDPAWRGEREGGSGRPRETTEKEDRAIVKHVLEKRGKQKVTVKNIKRALPWLKRVSDTLVSDRIGEAELAYLRRRNKSKVTRAYLGERVQYCQAVKRKRTTTLESWAYTDGTVYYLDRTEAEFEESGVAALGPFVYRRTDRRDAMFQDCLGPSSYRKGQGSPVRVWGMLACGRLHIHILDEGEVMNQDLFVDLVEDKFERWAGNCCYLVQDFERCLRTELSVAAIRKAGLELVDGYPRCSQDFNAIENCWHILKERLDETIPKQRETREAFIKRLRGAVAWANRRRADQLWRLSTNQKERADDCLASKPPGGRTKF